jgi:hypothetical protein
MRSARKTTHRTAYARRLHHALAVLIVGTGAVLIAADPDRAPRQGRRAGQPQATGVIVGQVVEGTRGQPVPGAVVTLSAPGGSTIASGRGGISLGAFGLASAGRTLSPDPPQQVIADPSGRFVFRNLPAGSYQLVASAPAHAGGAYGQTRPAMPARLLELSAGQNVPNVMLRLWSPGSVTGRVVDDAGEPMAGVLVRALLRNIVNAQMRLTLGASARTDDRGLYRIAGLSTGDYVIVIPNSPKTIPSSIITALDQARSRDDAAAAALTRDLMRSSAPIPTGTGVTVGAWSLETAVSGAGPAAGTIYPTTLFPGATTLSGAAVVAITSGEERGGIDFVLRPVPAFRVSGVLADAGTGEPARRVGVRLLSPDRPRFSTEMAIDAAVTVTDDTGQFTFLAVPGGQYVANVVRLAAGPEPLLWAEQPVTVTDADVTGLRMTLREGLRANGRIRFEGLDAASAQPLYERVAVNLNAAGVAVSGLRPDSRTTPSGDFSTTRFPPGRYFVTAAGPDRSGWQVKSAMAGGRDVANVALEIGDSDVRDVEVTLTKQTFRLTGTVRAAAGSIQPASIVILFPRDHAAWISDGGNPRLSRVARPAANGVFAMSNIPEGEFLIVAVADDSTISPQDSERYYASLAAVATRVTAAPGLNSTFALTSRTIK